jgi:hypothetical protein
MHKSGEEIFLLYKGLIKYDTIGQLISELKEKMFESHVKQAVYKKVLMVMIEALENVFKYHEHFDKDKKIVAEFPPQILILKDSHSFRIKCSNPLRAKDLPILKERIEKINYLDKNGVKEAYKKIITNGKFSEKGGAGLGIVEMAKISDEKLEFTFQPINEDFYYYSLSLTINLHT